MKIGTSIVVLAFCVGIIIVGSAKAFHVNRPLHLCKAPASVAVGKIGAGIGTSCPVARAVAKRSYAKLPARKFNARGFACTSRNDNSAVDVQCVSGSLYVGYSAYR